MFRLQGHGAVILGCNPKKKGFTGCESVALAAEQPANRYVQPVLDEALTAVSSAIRTSLPTLSASIGLPVTVLVLTIPMREKSTGKHRVNRGLRSRLHLQD
jgi:hypothetical protein